VSLTRWRPIQLFSIRCRSIFLGSITFIVGAIIRANDLLIRVFVRLRLEKLILARVWLSDGDSLAWS
jgi:hypothetical protein